MKERKLIFRIGRRCQYLSNVRKSFVKPGKGSRDPVHLKIRIPKLVITVRNRWSTSVYKLEDCFPFARNDRSRVIAEWFWSTQHGGWVEKRGGRRRRRRPSRRKEAEEEGAGSDRKFSNIFLAKVNQKRGGVVPRMQKLRIQFPPFDCSLFLLAPPGTDLSQSLGIDNLLISTFQSGRQPMIINRPNGRITIGTETFNDPPRFEPFNFFEFLNQTAQRNPRI